jgi:hypothetical protein
MKFQWQGKWETQIATKTGGFTSDVLRAFILVA